jgi:Uncharacterized protein conserved in bacteria
MNAFHKFKKGDIFLMLLIGIIISIPLLGNNFRGESQSVDNSRLMAVIMQNGKIVQELDLNKVQDPQYIKLEQGNITVLAETGRIRILESDCPDKICVNMGWLTQLGDQAICMPNQTLVMIEEEDK